MVCRDIYKLNKILQYFKINVFGICQRHSQGLQSGGDKLSAKGVNTVGESGGMLPQENFEIQSL
jgi:hypothetical protein